MREEIIGAAVERVSRIVVDALQRGDAPTPDALRLLLRGYAATGRDDFRDVLEPGLARALEIAADSPSEASPGWLILFAEAAEASDDERLRNAVSNLASKIPMNWGPTRPIALAARSVDACLRANVYLPEAIDELERLVSAKYEPGQGMSDVFEDEISVAAALLTAFAVTDRLPYAMLAEELARHACGALLEPARVSFAAGCEAASVLARLAALHHNEEYVAAAVIAPGAQYEVDAAGILERLAGKVHNHGLAAASYGLAAGELRPVL